LKVLSDLKTTEDGIRAEHAGEFSEDGDLDSYVEHVTDDLHNQAHMYATSSFLMACMAVEGLINNYGTRRLGEDFYKKNLERLGITEKLSVLMLICLGVALDKNDPIIAKVRSLFDSRNRLVHPKTKEFDFEHREHANCAHPKDLELERSLEDVEWIIDRLHELDPALKRYSILKRPNQPLHRMAYGAGAPPATR
jgi:roadblock/LC7 domain-containing protein